METRGGDIAIETIQAKEELGDISHRDCVDQNVSVETTEVVINFGTSTLEQGDGQAFFETPCPRKGPRRDPELQAGFYNCR